jgi:chorismate mutase-like protein
MRRMDLSELRLVIDEIDMEILRLLNKRTSMVLRIKNLKEEKGLPFYAPERVEAIVRTLLGHNEGPLHDQAVEEIFRKILAISLSLEEK